MQYTTHHLLKAVPSTCVGTADRIFDGHFVNCGWSTHSILSRKMLILRHRIVVIPSSQPTMDYRQGEQDHALVEPIGEIRRNPSPTLLHTHPRRHHDSPQFGIARSKILGYRRLHPLK